MNNVIPISTHPQYNPSFASAVRDAMQEMYELPLEVVSLGERLMANPLFVRDVFGDGPEAA